MIHMHGEKIKITRIKRNAVLNYFFFSFKLSDRCSCNEVTAFCCIDDLVVVVATAWFHQEILSYSNETYLPFLTNCTNVACGHFGWSWLAENLIGCPKCTRLQLFSMTAIENPFTTLHLELFSNYFRSLCYLIECGMFQANQSTMHCTLKTF